MAFKLSNEQVTKRSRLAVELREKAHALNEAVVAFNDVVAPLSRAIDQAQESYNATLEMVRALSGAVSESAQVEYDAKSERWQDSDVGIQVRLWIESWEMSFDDIDLDPPSPLEEIDEDEHADELEDAARSPAELELKRRRLIHHSG